MPVYQYEGKHYSLDDGLSNEQAIAKIEGHLGKIPKVPTFDAASQIPGQVSKPAEYDPEKDEGFLDKYVRGPLEAGLQIATGLPTGLVGPMVGLATPGTIQEKDKAAGKFMEEFTYAPRGSAGQRYGAGISEAMNQLAIPAAGLVGTMPSIRVSEGVNAAKSRFNKPALPSTLDRLDAADAARRTPEPTAPIADPMQRIVDELGYREGESSPLRTQTATQDMAGQLSKRGEEQRTTDAQATIDARQVALENESSVTAQRRQALEERQRQENAPAVSEAHKQYVAEQVATEKARLDAERATLEEQRAQVKTQEEAARLAQTEQSITQRQQALEQGVVAQRAFDVFEQQRQEASNLTSPKGENPVAAMERVAKETQEASRKATLEVETARAKSESLGAAQKATEARMAAIEADMRSRVDDIGTDLQLQRDRDAITTKNAFLRKKQEAAAVLSSKERTRIAKEKSVAAQVTEKVRLEQEKARIAKERIQHEQLIVELRQKQVAAERASAEATQKAQSALNDRAEQTRLEVAQKTSLDMNAAERTRQEAGPLPPAVGPLPLGSKARQRARGRGKKQGGFIDPDLLGLGLATKFINWVKDNNKVNPLKTILEKYKGTFNEAALARAYRESIDPKAKEHLVMMTPDTFHALASDRGSQHLTNPSSGRSRLDVREGLDSKAGLHDVPYLTIDEKGQVTGHEGRHRMDVLKSKGVDQVPIRIVHTGWRNEPGAGDAPKPTITELIPQKAVGSAIKRPNVPMPEQLPSGPKDSWFSGSKFNDLDKVEPNPYRVNKDGNVEMNSGMNPRDGIDALMSLFHTAEAPDGLTIPKSPVMSAVLEVARGQGDSKIWKYVQSGATSAAMKSGSAAIKAAADIVQGGMKRIDSNVRKIIFPVEQTFRKLKIDDIKTLSDIFKKEMFKGEQYHPEALAEVLTTKQLEGYVAMRDMFKKTLDVQNASREQLGMKPITASEAYLSSRWDGDFRRPVYVPDGKGGKKLAWYLASNTKAGLEAQTRGLQRTNPDIIVDPKNDHQVTSYRNANDLQSMLTTMIDLVGRDDPAVVALQKAAQEQLVTMGQGTYGQLNHAEPKRKVRGFVGDRPNSVIAGVEFTRNPKKEALAMFEQQIQYAKNAIGWAEMQKMADEMKPLLTDQVLKETQPNNMAYIKEYFKNAMGYGESRAIKAMEDSMREGLGISPKLFSDAVGNAKSFFILQKIGASAGYVLANAIQVTNVIPYMADLRSLGYKGNPVTALGVGATAGPAMAALHYANSMGIALPNMKNIPSFFKEAFKYAEDNGVTARSIVDESPIGQSFGTTAQVGKALGLTLSVPETFVRSTAFMTYVEMLRSSGKYTDNQALFKHAEELVNKSMVDYRESERALAFTKMGTTGNALNTLQTYPMSFYNQYAYMMGRAMEGSVVPLLSMLALQQTMAGVMGMPYVGDTEKLFQWIKNNAVSNSTFAAMQESPFLKDPKGWALETLGHSAVNGFLSDKTGLAMQSRVAAPGVAEMLQAPVGPIVDISKQATNLAKAIMDPTNRTKWAQSAMSSVPTGLSGLLETASFMKDSTYVDRPNGNQLYMASTDLEARNGKFERTPEDITKRKWGFRTPAEQVAGDQIYKANQESKSVTERSSSVMTDLYDAARRGDKEDTQKYAQLYVRLTGRKLDSSSLQEKAKKEFFSATEKAGAKKNPTPAEMMSYMRTMKILEELGQ